MVEITILMAVYNGASHLHEQMASFAMQTGVTWRLIASDDGSTDDSVAIIDRFAGHYPGQVTRVDGPQRGAGANFLHLLHAVPDDTPLVALSDQDDVWLPEKLSRAARALESAGEGPALYCSRTQICDDALTTTGESRRFPRPASFRNALVQNMAPGNTIVLNRAALDLARAAAAEAGEIVIHDWWLYQLLTGVGGTVIHDPRPGLLYRQHNRNVMGSPAGLRAKLARARMLMRGGYRDWNSTNIAALQGSAHRLTRRNRVTLRSFAQMRDQAVLPRMAWFAKSGIHRQSRIGQAALWVAMLLGRV